MCKLFHVVVQQQSMQKPELSQPRVVKLMVPGSAACNILPSQSESHKVMTGNLVWACNYT